MTNTDPDIPFDDQLLSAYVDGELSEDQRAQVERRLREDMRARELVAELRALSESLRKLPQEAVGEDLCEAVLRQAERAMLLGEPSGQVDSAVAARRETSSPRRWIWAAAATAAALFLMVFQQTDNRQEPSLANAKPKAGRVAQTAPELRAPAEQPSEAGAMEHEEPFAVAKVMDSPKRSEANGAEPLCRVHVTLADSQTGTDRFDELLQRQGIAFRKPADSSAHSDAELVMVEATPRQIEQLLTAFNVDTKNYQSLRLEMKEGSSLRFSRWRELQRDGQATDRLGSRSMSTLSKGKVAAQAQTPKPEKGKQLRADNNEERKKAAEPNDAATIRVLFVLHPAAPASDTGAKPSVE